MKLALVAGLTDAVEIAAGRGATCARLAGGTVSCWGAFGKETSDDVWAVNSPVPVPVAGLTDVVAISLTVDQLCARHADGTASCLGRHINPLALTPTPVAW